MPEQIKIQESDTQKRRRESEKREEPRWIHVGEMKKTKEWDAPNLDKVGKSSPGGGRRKKMMGWGLVGG